MSYRHQVVRSSITWVVVADRAAARVFEADLSEPAELEERQTLLFEESRLRPGEALSDRPGTFLSDTGVRGSGDPRTDFRHRTGQQFANRLAQLLEQGRCQNQFGHVVLIAPPFFLGLLRQELTPGVRELVDAEVEKELTHARAEDVGELVRRTLLVDGTNLD